MTSELMQLMSVVDNEVAFRPIVGERQFRARNTRSGLRFLMSACARDADFGTILKPDISLSRCHHGNWRKPNIRTYEDKRPKLHLYAAVTASKPRTLFAGLLH
jgi:hypothetical protein